MTNRLNLRPHQLVRRKGVVVVGEGTDPYVCLRNGDGPEVYVQRGHFFWAGGEEIPPGDVPAWVEAQCKLLTPNTRKEVGLVPAEELKKR